MKPVAKLKCAVVCSMTLFALCFLPFHAQAQSVADIARQNQQRVQNRPAENVITNDDMPVDGLADEDAIAPRHPALKHKSDPDSAKVLAMDKEARSFRTRILTQKSAISALQARIDHETSAVHFARASVSYNAAQTNTRAQAKLDEIQALNQQMESERKKLEDLQESARKAGFGNGVYDP
jgi:predicted RNase H-like nuclease (RuvC/YqgF family)